MTSVSTLTRDSSIRSDDHLMMDEMMDDNVMLGGGQYHRYGHYQQKQQQSSSAQNARKGEEIMEIEIDYTRSNFMVIGITCVIYSCHLV